MSFPLMSRFSMHSLIYDSVEGLLIVNETEIYILPTLYVYLNYCSEIVNSFPGTFSCHKATTSRQIKNVVIKLTIKFPWHENVYCISN